MFKELTEITGAIGRSWPETGAFLKGVKDTNGAKFNQQKPIPGTKVLFSVFDARLNGLIQLLAGLGEVSEDAALTLPFEYSNALIANSRQLLDHLDAIAAQCARLDDVSIEQLNPDTWEIDIPETNETVNFASLLLNVFNYVEHTLKAFHQVGLISGAAESDAFGHAITELTSRLEEVRAAAEEIAHYRDDSETAAGTVSENAKQTAEKNQEIQTLLHEATKNLGEIGTALEASKGLHEEAQTIRDAAGALQEAVSNYQSEFETFQEEIDKRNADFKEWSGNIEVLEKRHTDQINTISDTISQSEEMLKGATNAGLASTFNTTRNDLELQLKWARRGFYFSIALVFASAVPLVVFLLSSSGVIDLTANQLPEDAGFWKGLVSKNSEFKFSTFTALILIMAPPVWLTKFAAARHNQLFQLREHYHYKYSLAMAVEGFKKQAPAYEDAIAAETFRQLLFNPADRLEGRPAEDHPSPLLDYLMNRLGFNSRGEALSDD